MAAPHHSSTSSFQLPKGRINKLTKPIRQFLKIESASGFVLVGFTLIALILANSPWAKAVHDFWDTPLRIGLGTWNLEHSLHFWVNDALMTLFFFVVGLEIKREIAGGELSTPQKAALPVIAALGGMLIPAGIYMLLQPGGDAARGWGIPMATDIAFVVGVLAVFGSRVPFSLKIFLLSLAIADDVGAILVIAVAYSAKTNFLALGIAFLLFGLCYVCNRSGVRSTAVYLIIGILAWFAVLASGVHPTIEGVILGLLTPSVAWVQPLLVKNSLSLAVGKLEQDEELEQYDREKLANIVHESVSPLDRLMHLLHPWVGFVIMPIFALANAGVEVRLDAITDPVAMAVGVGLLLGKPLGIVLFCFIAVKLGLAQLPTGISWLTLLGGGFLAGIGFTMSLFISTLALPSSLLDAGKVGILIGSLLSALVGVGILLSSLPKKSEDS
jgi:Na+:H+ antiporter, NhaA family